MSIQTGLEIVINKCCYSQKTDFNELQDEEYYKKTLKKSITLFFKEISSKLKSSKVN